MELITDRTAQDVQQVLELIKKPIESWTDAEKEWWYSGPKGAYNSADLNRVEAAVDYVAKRLIPTGYIMEYEVRTDWKMSDFPSASEMDRFLDNVRKIRAGLVTGYVFPNVPENMEKFDYQKANDIEKILVLVDSIIDNVLSSYYYSGELFSGEV